MAKKTVKSIKAPIHVLLTDTHMKMETIELNKSIFEQALIKAQEFGLKQVLHAGDIFESRKAQPQEVLRAFKDILDMFDEAGVKLIAIPGNHDKTDYNSEGSFLDPYQKHPAFRLHTTGVAFHEPSDAKIGVSYLPFFADEMYIQELDKLNGLIERSTTISDKSILITHIGMNGAVMNNGIAVESAINEELFKHFDLVLIGHYHDASDYSKKIKYIGSSLQHNFGETPDKGLCVVYDDLSTEIVPLDFPQYKTITLNAKDVDLKKVNELKALKQATSCNVRVVLTGSEKDIKAVDKVIFQNEGIKVAVQQDEIVEEELEQRVEAFDATTLAEAFKEFCKKNKLDEKVGLKYLKAAL